MEQKKFSTMLTLKIINVFLADNAAREASTRRKSERPAASRYVAVSVPKEEYLLSYLLQGG